MTERKPLNADEISLLHWLSREDFSQYGECFGKSLDSLVERGFAQLHGDNGRKDSFIAKGDSQMYQSVSVTDAGRALLAKREGKS